MSDWCFSLRDSGGSFSSDEDSDAETCPIAPQPDEETIEFKENPWSIAKINAVVRPPPPVDTTSTQRAISKPRHTAPKARSNPVKDAKTISFGVPPPKSQHVGPLFDAFKKQAALGKTKSQEKKVAVRSDDKQQSRQILPPSADIEASKRVISHCDLPHSQAATPLPAVQHSFSRVSPQALHQLSSCSRTARPSSSYSARSMNPPKRLLPPVNRSTPPFAAKQGYHSDISMAKHEPLSDPPDALMSPTNTCMKADNPLTPTSSPFPAKPLNFVPRFRPSPQLTPRSPGPNFERKRLGSSPADPAIAYENEQYSPGLVQFQQQAQSRIQTQFSQSPTRSVARNIGGRFQNQSPPNTSLPTSPQQQLTVSAVPTWISDMIPPRPTTDYIKHESPKLEQAFPSPSPSPPRRIRPVSPIKPSVKRDPYAFGAQDDPDATWSTLPKKRVKAAIEPFKKSGAFTLRGIGLGASVRAGITGMKENDGRRVITFLPPPLPQQP